MSVVVVGMGELGSVFARGFLKLGYEVRPVLRTTDRRMLATWSIPETVLIAVGKPDLQTVVSELPISWQSRMIVLQNELRERDIRAFEDISLAVVWFEKKKGKVIKPIIPTRLFGPHALLLADALEQVDVPTRQITASEVGFELAFKNIYILVSNLCGLKVGGNVGELWAIHGPFCRQIFDEVLQLEIALSGLSFDAEEMWQRLGDAFAADPAHMCKGRSAPARLTRALADGQEHGISLPSITLLTDCI